MTKYLRWCFMTHTVMLVFTVPLTLTFTDYVTGNEMMFYLTGLHFVCAVFGFVEWLMKP